MFRGHRGRSRPVEPVVVGNDFGAGAGGFVLVVQTDDFGAHIVGRLDSELGACAEELVVGNRHRGEHTTRFCGGRKRGMVVEWRETS